MIADSSDKLASAIERLQDLGHDGYRARLEKLLEQQEEWVQMHRNQISTRGQNTNNFSEATIRILKDIILSRMKAFNAVAPLHFICNVWEQYFEARILSHAYNRVASHRLAFEKLLKRLPKEAATSVVPLGENVYQVPSATESKTYEVYGELGTCTCPNGMQGAFCKHQALIYKTFGGAFDNAPVLTPEGRHKLGKLALGNTCPSAAFFNSFRDEPDTVQSALGKADELPAADNEGSSQRESSPQSEQDCSPQPSTSGCHNLAYEVCITSHITCA